MIQLTALDWGTSSFRGYLLDDNGNIVEKISADAGILSVTDGDFPATLRQQLARFSQRQENSPLIASGMITSKNGWYETPYVTCPAAIDDLATSLSPLETEEFGTILFVAGVNQFEPDPDIMRGEETQLAGLARPGRLTVLLPGTHSKWVAMQDGRIEQFSTFMTGDVYKAVLEHTILKSAPDAEWSDEAYLNGVKSGFERTKKQRSMLSGLFQARVRGILELMPMEDTRSYLSGLLVGAEIGEAVACGLWAKGELVVLGDARLTGLYLNALAICGIKAEAGPDDIVAHGLYRIYQQATL